MSLATVPRHAIKDPRDSQDRHGRRREGRWHPYQMWWPKKQRPLHTSIPSPETSSKETSPKAQYFPATEQLARPQKRSAGAVADPVQYPSPPPSDGSDQAGAGGRQPNLSQSVAAARLQSILAEPIHWVAATQKTFDTEVTAVAHRQALSDSTSVNRSPKPLPNEKGHQMLASPTGTPRQQKSEASPGAVSSTARGSNEQQALSKAEAISAGTTDEEATDKAAPSKHAVKVKRHSEQERKDSIISDLIKSGRVSKGWPAAWAKGKRPRGLSNPGQYCYRRSVMQAFLQTPPFISWLAGHKAPSECPGGNSKCIACVMRALMRAYYGDQPVQQALRNFDKCFNVLWPQTRLMSRPGAISALNSRQQDADEFVTGLLDAFCDAPRRELPMPTATRDALFNMAISQTWHCTNVNCKGREHTTIQSERGLILDIRKPREGLSITEYINQYFKGDVLEEVTCDVCKKRQRRRPRRMQLLAGPEVLIIQLRRFYHFGLGDRSNGRKCSSRVGTEPTLDLGALQPAMYQGKNELLYELKHTIIHQGSGISNGHYVSTCSGPTGPFLCDDSSVVPARRGMQLGGSPYLLVYTRK